jgi:multicomponent Na+:H+ antiporter subunit G
LREVVIAVLVLTGAALSLIAALGLHRFSDAYARLHAAGKAGTLGLALVLSAAIIWHGTAGGDVVTLLFVLLTTPVATHMITKAMYETGHRPWESNGREAEGRKAKRRRR